MTQMKLARRAAAGLIVGGIMQIAALESVLAAEWRFCIAPSNQEHKIYMTAPFPASIAMEAIESAFHLALERTGRRHDSVQCPTGADEPTVRAMRQHADDFNRQLGIEVVPVDWRPAPGR
jgi:hypothetical protein